MVGGGYCMRQGLLLLACAWQALGPEAELPTY